jgi:HK97 gp10 family phage protein
MPIYGFDTTEFNEMIEQLEKMGADVNSITETVLDAGSESTKQAFIKNMPPNSKKDKEHARDNVEVSKTKTARKSKNKYRVIGALNRKFEYLYYVENGTSKAPAHPFIEKAYREAKDTTTELMVDAFNKEFDKYMGG